TSECWLPGADVELLQLVVCEAATNGLIHGRAPVRVELAADDCPCPEGARTRGITALVTDAGGGFAPSAVSAPGPEDEHGRGLWLIAELCDWVCWGDEGRGVAMGVGVE